MVKGKQATAYEKQKELAICKEFSQSTMVKVKMMHNASLLYVGWGWDWFGMFVLRSYCDIACIGQWVAVYFSFTYSSSRAHQMNRNLTDGDRHRRDTLCMVLDVKCIAL